MNSQSYIVNRWFSDKERALATSLFSASMVMGNGISYAISGFMFENATTDEEIKASIQQVFVTQTYIVFCVFIFFQLVFRERPD